jgi:hypothetical protein
MHRAQPALEFNEIVTRVSRDVASDPRLRAGISDAELTQIVERAVVTLWSSSRVKTYVPLLAVRQLRVELALTVQDWDHEEDRG